MFREAIARSIRLAAVLVFFLLAPSALTFGGAAETEKPSPDVQEFLKLLGKSDVQEWLRGQQTAAAGPDDPQAQKIKASVGRALSERLTAIRTHLANLLLVIPGLGNEIRQATQRLHDASGGSGFLSIFVGAFLLVGLGFAAQAYVRNRLPPGHQPATENEEPSPASTQFQGLAVSLVRELTRALAFCVACFAPLLLLERDQLSESVLLNFLLAGAAWMLARAVASVIDALAANDPSPDDHAEKRHFCFWMVAAVGWFALGSAIAETARITGMDPLATDLVSYVLGLGLLVIGLTAIWRAPRKQVSSPERLVRYSAWRWLATLFLIVLWTVWIAGAMRLFWLLAVSVTTPIALVASRKLTRSLFQQEQDDGSNAIVSSSIVVVDTLLRAALIGIALWILAAAWDINFLHLAAQVDPISRVARALLNALAILFTFDVLWQFTKTAIDLKIARVDEAVTPGSVAGVRQARFRTLLPVLRNFLMVVFATLSVLMTLSTLGVQIGPLVASAGVVGLAIGFGAQTLVKDIISGVFYLLDDAFRVGEYIVSGNHTGTVESFSLRSIRLRHQNGPVYTIPFNLLGAVQNMSRDFAVDKLLITVSYDTDLEKARKLIRRVGEQLMEDPELAPVIIQPLKMQAVNEFGAYGIQLKLKITTKPGSQSAVRKTALPLLKKAFDDNGIEFAYPTVKVAEGRAAEVAAGQQVLAESTKPA